MSAGLAYDEGIGLMSIVFFCQSCGSRFDVEERMAGKQGRCKKCGKQMAVPKLGEPASAAARRVPAAVGVGVSAGSAPASSWLAEVAPSQVGLAPLTIDRMPGLKNPSMFAADDLADSKPYLLAQPERRSGGRPVSQVSGLKVFWRQRLGFVEKIFRSINQTAYLISVPFLMILLLGIMVRSHPLSNLGAIVVVLLNITRLVTGFINLVVIPFRDGINFKRLKKPIRRVVEPAITIGLVGLAFAFIPWLSKSDTSDATFSGQLRAGVRKIERKFEDAKEKATDKAKALGIGPDDKKPES
jgi:DNA-directed RNA polymerase subunit RPC12/RpoP